jgi:hypothetical protein
MTVGNQLIVMARHGQTWAATSAPCWSTFSSVRCRCHEAHRQPENHRPATVGADGGGQEELPLEPGGGAFLVEAARHSVDACRSRRLGSLDRFNPPPQRLMTVGAQFGCFFGCLTPRRLTHSCDDLLMQTPVQFNVGRPPETSGVECRRDRLVRPRHPGERGAAAHGGWRCPSGIGVNADDAVWEGVSQSWLSMPRCG